jgi:hypothetical protein
MQMVSHMIAIETENKFEINYRVYVICYRMQSKQDERVCHIDVVDGFQLVRLPIYLKLVNDRRCCSMKVKEQQ